MIALHHVQVPCPPGGEAVARQRETFPPYLRCRTRDGHGNRVELLQAP